MSAAIENPEEPTALGCSTTDDQHCRLISVARSLHQPLRVDGGAPKPCRLGAADATSFAPASGRHHQGAPKGLLPPLRWVLGAALLRKVLGVPGVRSSPAPPLMVPGGKDGPTPARLPNMGTPQQGPSHSSSYPSTPMWEGRIGGDLNHCRGMTHIESPTPSLIVMGGRHQGRPSCMKTAGGHTLGTIHTMYPRKATARVQGTRQPQRRV